MKARTVFNSAKDDEMDVGKTHPALQNEPKREWSDQILDFPEEYQRILATYQESVSQVESRRQMAAESRYQIRLRAFNAIPALDKLKERAETTKDSVLAYHEAISVHSMVEQKPVGFQEALEDLTEIYNALCAGYVEDMEKIGKISQGMDFSAKLSEELTRYCQVLYDMENRIYQAGKKVEKRILAGERVGKQEAFETDFTIPTVGVSREEREITDYLDMPQSELYCQRDIPDLDSLRWKKKRRYSLSESAGGIGYRILFNRPEWNFKPITVKKMEERRRLGKKRSNWIKDFTGFLGKLNIVGVLLSSCLPEVVGRHEKSEEHTEDFDDESEGDSDMYVQPEFNQEFLKFKREMDAKAKKSGRTLDPKYVLNAWLNCEYEAPPNDKHAKFDDAQSDDPNALVPPLSPDGSIRPEYREMYQADQKRKKLALKQREEAAKPQKKPKAKPEYDPKNGTGARFLHEHLMNDMIAPPQITYCEA